MNNSQINPKTIKYAILQDASYRKNISNDQGFDVDKLIEDGLFDDFVSVGLTTNREIAVTYRDGSPDSSLVLSEDNVHFYNPDTGFSAFIVKDGDKTVITFRGTDATLSILGTLVDVVLNDAEGSGHQTDVKDGDFANGILGFGTTEISQWDDVRTIVEAVLKTTDASQVAVVGQSLGGGLAGLATAVYGLEGHVYAPASFAKQLDIEAEFGAIESIIEFHKTGLLRDRLSDSFINQLTVLQKNSLSYGDGLLNPLIICSL